MLNFLWVLIFYSTCVPNLPRSRTLFCPSFKNLRVIGLNLWNFKHFTPHESPWKLKADIGDIISLQSSLHNNVFWIQSIVLVISLVACRNFLKCTISSLTDVKVCKHRHAFEQILFLLNCTKCHTQTFMASYSWSGAEILSFLESWNVKNPWIYWREKSNTNSYSHKDF